MRENERIKSHDEILPESKTTLSTSTNVKSNVPLMLLTPTSSSSITTTSNSSSAMFQDLTSTLFDPNPPSKPFDGISISPTMPSLPRPTMISSLQQIRPTLNFSSSSNNTDLTSSLLNNIHSLTSRSQTTSTTVSMMTNSSMPSPYFNSGNANNASLFQPPPPPGRPVIKNSTNSSNIPHSKTATSELDDLFR